MSLPCGGNSVTGTISCNPSVVLTEFNSTSCASKWSGSISSTCGTVSLGVNNGNCSNNYPPLWPITANLTGCPSNCCCTTNANCQIWYVESEGGGVPPDFTDDGHTRGGPFWSLADAQADLADKQANPVSGPCTCGTVTGPGGYCCDGQCKEEPCLTRWPPGAPRPPACGQCAPTETCYTRSGVFVRCANEGNPLP
jgi:hypothetical protein